MSAENPPQGAIDTLDEVDIIEQMEREFGADPRNFGEVALMDEVYIEAGLDELANFANAAEEDKRVHDIDDAFDAAIEENELFNLHTDALRENEMFDLHTQAIQENEIFDAHTDALKEDEKRTEQKAEEAQAKIIDDEKQSLETEQHNNTPENVESDFRKQAEVALKDAGVMESIPLDSHIQKDFITGNLLIIGTNDVKVLESRPGGQTRMTEYAYDDDKKVLTIRSQGAIVTARVGDFVQSETNQPYKDVMKLPPAVAQAMGFEKVIPITQVA